MALEFVAVPSVRFRRPDGLFVVRVLMLVRRLVIQFSKIVTQSKNSLNAGFCK